MQLIDQIRKASPSVPTERSKRETQTWAYRTSKGMPPKSAYETREAIHVYGLEATYDPDITPAQLQKRLIHSAKSQWNENPAASVLVGEQLILDPEVFPDVLDHGRNLWGDVADSLVDL